MDYRSELGMRAGFTVEGLGFRAQGAHRAYGTGFKLYGS